MSGQTPDELRLIAHTAHMWIPLLKQRESRIIGRLCGEFRAGERDLAATVAELCSVRDQIHELENAIRTIDKK